ncbi:MAG TPA: flagellar basal body P-ring protein FlgI [Phycisphaerae bacterium]
MSAWKIAIAGTLPALALSLTGCLGKFVWFEEPKKEPVKSTPMPEASPAVRDTIGASATLEGMRRMRVRGYGLVIGLGENGSADCPRPIRERLVQEILKRPEFSRSASAAQAIDPEKMIDSLDTAVVILQGEIPSAAPAHTSFDLTVEAVPGSQTRSLEGGHLLPCDLSLYREVTPGTALTGQVLASAEGPVFLNPFASSDEATRVDRRRGYILGGGRSQSDRRVRLILLRPSYQESIAIAQRINARFPQQDKIADAGSRSFVTVKIPRKWHADPGHFLAVLQHLYVPSTPGFADQRTVALVEEIKRPDALHADIALALEGIGRNVIPKIAPLYSDPLPAVNFYSSLAGLRLGDDAAVQVMELHATDPHSHYRMEAIEALGAAVDSGRAVLPLRRCLSDNSDPRVQVAAYEALRRRDDPSIRSTTIAGDNFVLDAVEAEGASLIYAKRAGQRRIALLGSAIQFVPPVFYRQPDGLLTINAGETDSELTVIRRHPLSGHVGAAIRVPLQVDQVLALLGSDPDVDSLHPTTGLGVDYSTLVQMLSELCGKHSINAKFMLEQAGMELFGPIAEVGRPESEL